MNYYVLGIDTSSLWSSVALSDGNNLISNFEIHAPRKQTSILPYQVYNVLRMASLSMEDLSLISVTSGPGSFTGVKVGIAFAKALAFGMGIRLVSFNTLETMIYYTSEQKSQMKVAIIPVRENKYLIASKKSEEKTVKIDFEPKNWMEIKKIMTENQKNGSVICYDSCILPYEANEDSFFVNRIQSGLAATVTLLGYNRKDDAKLPEEITACYMRPPDVSLPARF